MAQKMNVQYIRLYTDGSAARQLSPEPKPKAVLPKPRKQRRRVLYVDPVAVLGITVAVCMLIMMAVGMAQLNAAQEERIAMERYVGQLSQENAALSDAYHAGYDLEEIRQTALALDMIPAEEAAQITIQIQPVQSQQEQISLWEQLGTFLTGLFA